MKEGASCSPSVSSKLEAVDEILLDSGIISCRYDLILAWGSVIFGTVSSGLVIKWGNKLHDYNHLVHFKSNITCIIDTFPIVIYQPVDDSVCASLYSGKYKVTVLKVEISVTFTGELVCATGTHMGTVHDSKVYSYPRAPVGVGARRPCLHR